MESRKQGVTNNTSRPDGANHWCGNSRLHLAAAASLSTFVGHIYKCDSNGSYVQEAYVSTIEEAVRAYDDMFPIVIGNNLQSSKGELPDSKTGFAWIDLHGIPPPPHGTTNFNHKGSTMDRLWEALQLNQRHRLKLREEIKQEYQRRASMFGPKELDVANSFSQAVPVAHPDHEGGRTVHTAGDGQSTLSPDLECFCAGYASNDGLDTLDDPDTVHLFTKSCPNNCKGGSKEDYYAALRVATLMEHTVHHIPKMKEQISPACLTGEDNKQGMFHELVYASHAYHSDPFRRSVNSADGPTPHIDFKDPLHHRSDSGSVKSDSMDRLLENDEDSGALCVESDSQDSSLQFSITHVFCWEGLCVTWCPRDVSAAQNDRGCVWQVKNWNKLRETVLSHCIYSTRYLPQ